MKACLLGDTHLGIKNSNMFWLDLTYKLFEDVVDYCIKNNISKIIHLGDWFHTRFSLNVLSINTSYKILNLLERNGIHIYIIKGNHDTYYKNKPTPHSLMIFEKYHNVTIVDDPMEFDHEVLCPWNTLPTDTVKKFLLGHYEINGIATNASGYEITTGKLSINDFKQFEKVYSGHFHTRSSNKNIEYIGSTHPMDMNDINDTRGYYNYEDGHINEFIEFTAAPKFVKFTSDADFDTIEIQNNICKVVFVDGITETESAKIIDKIKSFNPKELYIDFKIKNEDQIEENPFIGDNSDMILHYIDNITCPTIGLDKKTLKLYVKKLDSDLKEN